MTNSLRGFLLVTAVLVTSGVIGMRAQDAPASAPEPAFEVASIKKSGPPPQGGMFFGMRPGGRFQVTQSPVSTLITLAYGIQRYQLTGGPSWINTDRFDINAKAEDGLPPEPRPTSGTPTRMQLMLRSLLKERFKLVVHRETRELPMSYLVVARSDGKLGERLRPSNVDCARFFAERSKAAGGGPVGFEPPKPGEVPPCGMMGGIGRLSARAMSLERLTALLTAQLDRPVFDRTNLKGNFDFDLEFTPDRMPQLPPGATLPPGLTLPSPDGPSLLTALQEQLGLKLENARGPVEMLVVDAIEQPTAD